MESVENIIAQKAGIILSELTERVCTELEKQYCRSFIVTEFIYTLGDGKIDMILSPKDDPFILFTSSIDLEADGEIKDTYVQFAAADELRTAIGTIFPDVLINAIPIGDGMPETDTGLSLRDYLKKHTNRVVLRIAAQKDRKPDQSTLTDVLQDASRVFGANLAAALYVFENEQYKTAEQIFASMPSVSESALRELQPISGFTLYIENGIVKRSALEMTSQGKL